jgi:hypothetical protein
MKILKASMESPTLSSCFQSVKLLNSSSKAGPSSNYGTSSTKKTFPMMKKTRLKIPKRFKRASLMQTQTMKKTKMPQKPYQNTLRNLSYHC